MKQSGKTKFLLCGIILTPLHVCLTLVWLAFSFSICTYHTLWADGVIYSNAKLPTPLWTRGHFCCGMTLEQCCDTGALLSGMAREAAAVSCRCFSTLSLSYTPQTTPIPFLFLLHFWTLFHTTAFSVAIPFSQPVPVTNLPFSLPASYLKALVSRVCISCHSPPRSPSLALHLLNAAD